MRKLKLICEEAQLHYAAAAIAITEAGMTPKLKEKGIMTRCVATESGSRRGEEVEYDVWFDPEWESVMVRTRAKECAMRFILTWPDLKLAGMLTARCRCHKGMFKQHIPNLM